MGFIGEKYLIRSETGYALFNGIKNLPIVDAHNHANVAEIAENKNYANPWQLFAATDHYVWEMLRKRGVKEEFITGDVEPQKKWMEMARVFPEIAGNPVYEWIHLDLNRYLGIDMILGPDTGEEIWEEAKAVLSVKSKRPQQLLDFMNVEVMCSTDDPVDLLEEHVAANKAVGRTLMRPTWRPDKAMNIHKPGWLDYMKKIEERFNTKLNSVKDLVQALKESHDYFAEKGCIASDHGLEAPLAGDAAEADADAVFKVAMNGESVSMEEAETFMSYILAEAAEMNAEKDWVFQLHLGAVRDIRDSLYENLGPDVGGDVSNHFIDILTPLKTFLNRFDDRLKVVLYCLEAGHQATLATVSRAFGQKVNLGSAWWLNDTPIGMRRQLEYICSTDTFYNFAGMVSDSRKLLSYGSRFEMFRRVLSDVLGSMVDYGQMPYPIAEKIAERMSYSGPKEFFNL